MKRHSIFLIVSLFLLVSCINKTTGTISDNWKTELNQQLPILGHRNWILIVDKAFPVQNSEGIITINTGEKLLPVLKYTLNKLNQSTHVKPNIFIDKELGFITSTQVSDIKQYRDSMKFALTNFNVGTLKHDSVFLKIDEAAKLFRIIVLKTEEVIPYSSVYIQLDCRYWDTKMQQELEMTMKKFEE